MNKNELQNVLVIKFSNFKLNYGLYLTEINYKENKKK